MLRDRTAEMSRVKWTVVVVALLSAGYFHGGAASNQNARLDAVFSFVEPGFWQGTFRIDRFMVAPERDINTADWARAGGHYYANKAPLSIVLGAAAYTLIYGAERGLGLQPTAAGMQLANSYLINFMVSVVGFAAACLMTFELLQVALSPLSAAALSLALCLGTALFPYSTQLWGHATAAAFVLAALVRLRGVSARDSLWGACWLAAALATDYMAGLAALGVALTHLWKQPRRLPLMAAGALPPLALMLAYHWVCFGSPWTLATTYSNPAYLDAQRALGIFAGPDWHALWALTFSPFRGLFLQMPVLCLAAIGFASWARRAPRDPWLWGCALTTLAGFLAIASFNGWHGGATVCARYLLPFVPLLFLAVAQISWTRWTISAAVVLGAISVVNMLAVAAVNPLCPDAHPNPLYGYTYAKLWAGELTPYRFPVRLLQYEPEWPALREWAMWNWGELMGLRGLGSLLPLLAAWLAAALWLARGQIRNSLPARTVLGQRLHAAHRARGRHEGKRARWL